MTGATVAAPGDEAVLAHARASTFAPGTNLKGRAAGAAWTLLLPSLELGEVLCVGRPPPATLRALARHAEDVVVAVPGRRRDRMDADDAVARAPRPDLVVVTGRRAVAALAAQPALRRAAAAARAVFVDAPGPPSTAFTALRLAPGAGEVHTAAAAGDADAVTLVEGLAAGERPPLVRTLKRLARGAPAARERGHRAGAVSIRGRAAGPLTTPAYVGDVARDAGLALEDHRAALWAPSQFASRKAVLFLFAPGERAPELVVKLTRDGAHNARLENEWRALRRLREAAPGLCGAAPRAVFLGAHAGLRVLGQSAVPGVAFRRRTTARADCPLARDTLHWLLDLGAATTHPVSDNARVGEGLGELLARYTGLYRPDAAERERLEGHVAALAGARRPLPLVLQHGDPGAWNVLAGDDGRPVFLDWEAAEPNGLPLWDAFYFWRSFAVIGARASGIPTTLGAAVRRQLLGDTPVNRVLAEAVDRHCARIGLDRRLIEPLFVTCWMHRALKEATRVRPDRLDDGHFAALVRLSLRERDAPGLRRLYATA